MLAAGPTVLAPAGKQVPTLLGPARQQGPTQLDLVVELDPIF